MKARPDGMTAASETIRIRVRTAGRLGQYLPAGSARNAAELSVPAGTSAAGLIELLGMPADQRYLVSVNGSLVPPSQRAGHTVGDGDDVAIMPPLRGGYECRQRYQFICDLRSRAFLTPRRPGGASQTRPGWA